MSTNIDKIYTYMYNVIYKNEIIPYIYRFNKRSLTI